MMRRIYIVVFLIVCAITDSSAQRVRGLTFGPMVDLPNEGISLRVFRNAQPVALPQPTVYRYRSPDGMSHERFTPRDLWYPGMYRGRWEDPAGNALILGVVGNLLPESLSPDSHVTRETYEQAFAASETGPPANLDELIAWASMFAGAPVSGSPRNVRSGPRLHNVAALDFEAHNPTRLGYVFQFGNNLHGIDPYQWFLALFELAEGVDATAAAQAIERDFVSALATTTRTADLSAQASARFQHPEMTDVERSAAFLESRERAINSIRGLRGWWFVETPNYVLVSDLSGGRRSFVQRLQEDLEAMREIFEHLFPPRRAIEAVSLVRIFGDGEDYVNYVGAENKWTGGLWMPSKRELVIRPFEWGNERERREQIARIVYHEAWHQYVHYAFDGLQTSPWFNEGLATFFEGADIRRGDLRVSEVERYADTIDALARAEAIDVPHLLRLSYDQFYGRGDYPAQNRAAHYAKAWGLIYYLMKAAPLDSSNNYEKILARYADALWETRDASAATRVAFDGVDMNSFNQQFEAFWLSPRLRHGAQRNNDLL